MLPSERSMRILTAQLPIVLLCLGPALRGTVAADPAQSSAVEQPKAKIKITIGKETTYITEPLGPDGYPDYVEAINQIYSRGVTPENNAAVPLIQAFGPRALPEPTREQALQRLGMTPLELFGTGQYLVRPDDVIGRWRSEHPKEAVKLSDDDLWAQFDAAGERPWSENEFPLVAQWLTANEQPLETAIEGIYRAKCYYPYLSAQHDLPPLCGVNLRLANDSRELANMLVSRANLRVKRGETEAAWHDLVACHRLARHIGRGGLFVEGLIGCVIEKAAAPGDAALAHYGALSAHRAMQMHAELRALPALPDLIEKADTAERFAMLDALLYLAHVPDSGRLKKV